MRHVVITFLLLVGLVRSTAAQTIANGWTWTATTNASGSCVLGRDTTWINTATGAQFWCSAGTWTSVPSGSGAPADAQYLVAAAHAGLSAEVVATTAGLALLDDADAPAQRTTLGLGSLATQSGTFSGTSSGTNTGDQTSVSGNAVTATALQTARNINGVSFNGTANITVPAAGSTLTDNVPVSKLNSGTGASGSTYWSGDGTWKTPAGGSGPVTVRKASDQSSTSTTFADVTGLTFSILASTSYRIECDLSYLTAATTTALQISLNGPTSPTAVRFTVLTSTSATAMHSASQSAYEANTNPASALTTALPVRLVGVVENGTNAGTLALRMRTEVASSSVTIQRGSSCVLF